MFQTFSGNSRRTRQVNLSGQNLNPFAATSWTPTASGTQKAVENAHQERQQRQQDRERLHASRRIQRAWRGHMVRKQLADSRRRLWDEKDALQGTAPGSDSMLADQLWLLVTFFSPRRSDDLDRLINLSQRISHIGYQAFFARPDTKLRLLRLAHITLSALQAYMELPTSRECIADHLPSSIPRCPTTLLELLVSIVDRHPVGFSQISQTYYTFLSVLCTKIKAQDVDKRIVVTAITTPLIEQNRLQTAGKKAVPNLMLCPN